MRVKENFEKWEVVIGASWNCVRLEVQDWVARPKAAVGKEFSDLQGELSSAVTK